MNAPTGPFGHLRWLLVPALVAAANAQRLDDSSFAACRDTVLPSAEEMAWRAIPWHDTFGGAVLEADDRELPVLLWAMNGHPLGCT